MIYRLVNLPPTHCKENTITPDELPVGKLKIYNGNFYSETFRVCPKVLVSAHPEYFLDSTRIIILEHQAQGYIRTYIIYHYG